MLYNYIVVIFAFTLFCLSYAIAQENNLEKSLSETTNILGYTSPAFLNIDTQLLKDSIGVIIAEGIEKQAFPGANVLVAKAGHIVFHQAYGYHTYDKKQPVRKDDIYDLASVTKITSALLILMKLYGDGKFDLDAPLKKYWPEFKKSNKAALTFREMLAHQARLKPWLPHWQNTLKKNGKFKSRTFKPQASKRYNIAITDQLYLHRKYKKKMYKAIKKSNLLEQEGYRYSGLLFYLLPEMLERLTGEDYETYLKKYFYEPLQAPTLTYNPLKTFPKERIVPTERDSFFRKTLVHGRVHDEGAAMMRGVSANAGLFANAVDLAKLAFLYLNKGNYNDQQLIAQNAIEEFTRCQYCEQDNRRALGFDKPLIEYDEAASYVAKSASPESYGHSGFTGTFVWIDPQTELIFIFLSNRVYPTRKHRNLYELNIRPRLQELVYQTFL